MGTLELLTTSERDRVKGIVFNKFRGDKSILKPGLGMLENRINKPVLGVIPYMHNLGIDDEDSVSLEASDSKYAGLGVRDEEIGFEAQSSSFIIHPSAFY